MRRAGRWTPWCRWVAISAAAAVAAAWVASGWWARSAWGSRGRSGALGLAVGRGRLCAVLTPQPPDFIMTWALDASSGVRVAADDRGAPAWHWWFMWQRPQSGGLF